MGAEEDYFNSINLLKQGHKTGSIVGNIGEDGQVYDRYGDPTDYTYGD